MKMKKTKHTTAIMLLIIGLVLTITGCDSESSKSHTEDNYNYNDYTEVISDEELARSAIYNNAYEFASKAKVKGVGPIVIASCSRKSGNNWRVMGHFYGQDSYGHTDGIYNFTCDVSVTDGYTSIYRCVVEKDY